MQGSSWPLRRSRARNRSRDEGEAGGLALVGATGLPGSNGAMKGTRMALGLSLLGGECELAKEERVDMSGEDDG